MNVFLTGATGYIGGAVAEALQKSGHRVTGLVRSDERAKTLEAQGIRAHRGNLLHVTTLERAEMQDGCGHDQQRAATAV